MVVKSAKRTPPVAPLHAARWVTTIPPPTESVPVLASKTALPMMRKGHAQRFCLSWPPPTSTSFALWGRRIGVSWSPAWLRCSASSSRTKHGINTDKGFVKKYS